MDVLCRQLFSEHRAGQQDKPTEHLMWLGKTTRQCIAIFKCPLVSGKQLLQLVTELRESGSHRNLDTVFARMQFELTMTIDIVEHPPTWGAGEPTEH